MLLLPLAFASSAAYLGCKHQTAAWQFVNTPFPNDGFAIFYVLNIDCAFSKKKKTKNCRNILSVHLALFKCMDCI